MPESHFDDEQRTEAARQLIGRILRWAADRPDFNLTFVHSVRAQMAGRSPLARRTGGPSANQLAALQSIVDRWGIP